MAGSNGNGRPTKPENPKKGAFLAALIEAGGHIGNACKATQVGRTTVYDWRKQDARFETAYHEAMDLGADILEDEATRRAIHGLKRFKFFQGAAITDPDTKEPYYELEYSDTLLIFLLKGIRPDKYRERISHKVDAKVTVTDGMDLLRDPQVANALDGALTRRYGRNPMA